MTGDFFLPFARTLQFLSLNWLRFLYAFWLPLHLFLDKILKSIFVLFHTFYRRTNIQYVRSVEFWKQSALNSVFLRELISSSVPWPVYCGRVKCSNNAKLLKPYKTNILNALFWHIGTRYWKNSINKIAFGNGVLLRLF